MNKRKISIKSVGVLFTLALLFLVAVFLAIETRADPQVPYNVPETVQVPPSTAEIKLFPTDEVPPKAKDINKTPPTAKELLKLVNEERAKVGAKPLTINANVQKSAQLKADDMSKRNYYSHIVKGTNKVLTPEMDRLLSAVCRDSSENIGKEGVTSKEAIDGYMNSPPHRRAILDPAYEFIGLGVSKAHYEGYYTVMHFCDEY